MHLKLHIGAHRAGSTAIQEFCANNWQSFLDGGIYYPANICERFPEQHSELALLVIEKKKSQLEKLLSRASEAASIHRASVVFLSGEEFCNLDCEFIAELKDISLQFFDSLSFFYISRNLHDFLLSNFKHQLSFGDQITEREFINAHSARPAVAVSNWRAYFSWQSDILPYEEISSSLIHSTLSRLFNLEIADNDMAQKVANPSFDLLSCYIRNIFTKQHAGPDVDKAFWDNNKEFSARANFIYEERIGTELFSLAETHDWLGHLCQTANASDREDAAISSDIQAVEICEKFIDLFSRLRQVFVSRSHGRLYK